MNQPSGVDASSFVSTFNISFWYVAGISLLLLIVLTATMIWFVYRYNRKRHSEAVQIEGNNKLEILWTVIPILLALTMFAVGWSGWKPTSKPPKDAMVVTSVARMWNFSFTYGNGKQNTDLVVPLDTPVVLNLVSLDVIHSLFIPAFRIKSDMVPGVDKKMWFLPRAMGTYDIFCAEYCGLSHSYMRSKVKVVSREEFETWYADTSQVIAVAADAGPGAAGEAIMRAQGCFACHSTDGSRIIGPTYLNLYGEQVTVERDGKDVTLTVDEEYIRRSVFDPNAEIVKGYQRNLMQPYTGILKDEDIAKIIEYLKSLNE